VHRDLKPPNIFRTRNGRTVVLDFGVAKLLAPDAPVRLTVTGAAVGTPHYMAPEQIRDAVGPSADIYAAGVVLYELLCNRLPFDGGNTVEIMHSHLEREPVSPRTLRGEIPQAVQDVVMKALAKDAGDRFPTAAAMRDALRAAIGGGDVHATRALRAKPVRAPSSKRGMVIAMSLAIAIVGIATAAWWAASREPTPATVTDAAMVAVTVDAVVTVADAAPTVVVTVADAAIADDEPANKEPTDSKPTRPGGTGWIEVRSSATGSRVRIDGAFRGVTPWNGPVTAGPHVVEVSAPDHKTFRTRVTIAKGELRAIRADLEPVP
jgi:serine/threonine-protein kinase